MAARPPLRPAALAPLCLAWATWLAAGAAAAQATDTPIGEVDPSHVSERVRRLAERPLVWIRQQADAAKPAEARAPEPRRTPAPAPVPVTAPRVAASPAAISPASSPDRKSTRLNSSHSQQSRMPSSA